MVCVESLRVALAPTRRRRHRRRRRQSRGTKVHAHFSCSAATHLRVVTCVCRCRVVAPNAFLHMPHAEHAYKASVSPFWRQHGSPKTVLLVTTRDASAVCICACATSLWDSLYSWRDCGISRFATLWIMALSWRSFPDKHVFGTCVTIHFNMGLLVESFL